MKAMPAPKEHDDSKSSVNITKQNHGPTKRTAAKPAPPSGQ